MKRASSGLGGPRIITPGLRGGAPQSLGVHPGSSTVPSGTFRQIPLCYAVLAQWVVGLMRATRTRAVRGSAFAQSSSGAHLIEAARACRVDRKQEGASATVDPLLRADAVTPCRLPGVPLHTSGPRHRVALDGR